MFFVLGGYAVTANVTVWFCKGVVVMFVVIEQDQDGSVRVLSPVINDRKEAEVEAAWISHLQGWSCEVKEVSNAA